MRSILVLLIIILELHCVNSFIISNGKCYSTSLCLKSDDNSDKFRVITPDNINSLFSNKRSNNNNNKLMQNEENIFNGVEDLEDDETLCDDEDEDFDLTSDDVTNEKINNPDMVQPDTVEEKDISSNVAIAPDIERSRASRSPSKVILMNGDPDVRIGQSMSVLSYVEATPSIEVGSIDNDIDKQTLSRADSSSWDTVECDSMVNKLDKSVSAEVIAAMTIVEPPEAIVSPSRVFTYDPKEIDKPDPMKYGAYRRWQAPSDSNTDSGKSTGNFLGKRKPKGNGGRKKGGDKDTFYDAIKNLGSGPVGPGTAATTGVAEPSDGRRPIQPKKAPMGKSQKKRVITPDEINSLFGNSQSARNTPVDEDDEDDNDDEFNFFNNRNSEVENQGNNESDRYSIQSLTSEEIPQWLSEGDKEAKKARKAALKGRRKKKGLVDDWRFWASIIVTTGFVAAAYSAYQQTGGFGMPGPGSFGNYDGNTPEMII